MGSSGRGVAPPGGCSFFSGASSKGKPPCPRGSSEPDPGAHGGDGTTREMGKRLPVWEGGRGAGTPPPGKPQLKPAAAGGEVRRCPGRARCSTREQSWRQRDRGDGIVFSMGREVAAAPDLGLRPKVMLLPGAPGGKALRRGDNAHVFPSRRTSPGDIAENHGAPLGLTPSLPKVGGRTRPGASRQVRGWLLLPPKGSLPASRLGSPANSVAMK